VYRCHGEARIDEAININNKISASRFAGTSHLKLRCEIMPPFSGVSFLFAIYSIFKKEWDYSFYLLDGRSALRPYKTFDE
jgi:hypothetical protein